MCCDKCLHGINILYHLDQFDHSRITESRTRLTYWLTDADANSGLLPVTYSVFTVCCTIFTDLMKLTYKTESNEWMG